jgi:hypothetical protein
MISLMSDIGSTPGDTAVNAVGYSISASFDESNVSSFATTLAPLVS